MPRFTKNFTKAIQVMLTEQEDQKIRQLAQKNQMKVGPMMRKLLSAGWDHAFANKPTCADATGCRCSAMHPITSPIDPMPPPG